MPMLRTARRSLARFCLLAAFLSLAACARQPGTESAVPGGKERAALGGFSLVAPPPDPETNLAPAILLFRGRDISQITEPVREISVDRTARFPLPECDSMVVRMFTGGANCCFGYYLLSVCPDGEHAAYIDPYDGGVGKPDPAMRAYPVSDAAFMYYTPERWHEPVFALSRVDSPRINRFLVYDNGMWRADRPGEFAAAYTALRAKARKEPGANAAARAIAVAYYSLMTGDDAQAVYDELEYTLLSDMLLPKRQEHIPAVVFEDIQRAVEGFSVVKNLRLGE